VLAWLIFTPLISRGGKGVLTSLAAAFTIFASVVLSGLVLLALSKYIALPLFNVWNLLSEAVVILIAIILLIADYVKNHKL
jgi:hypothetical protein